MDFTHVIEGNGWARITHADGETYRLRYNNHDEPLVVGELYIFTTDGQSDQSVHQTRSRVSLTRFEAVTNIKNSSAVCDSARQFLTDRGFPCLGDDIAAFIVRLVAIRDNNIWDFESPDGKHQMTVGTARADQLNG